MTSGGQLTMLPVGSTAVRDAIERYQPLLGLHGHIHDCRAMKRIGRSMCINPGSDYQTAMLRGAIVQLREHDVSAWTLTTG
jgi:Icc-related predicted phosphoesterase